MRWMRLTLCAVALAGCEKSGGAASAPENVLRVWFHHVERNELDSLRPLLTDDFRFVSDS